MKKLNLKNTFVISSLVFLFLTGCYHFDFVVQPFTADPNSSFDVQISVAKEYDDTGTGYFGVMLPVGWTIMDSILYTTPIANDTGFILYSESLSQQMTSIDPPAPNYYWWVGSSSVSGNYGTTLIINLTIYTDNQTGGFYLDYMLGDAGYGIYHGLNMARSNNHSIVVGDPVGCLPEGIMFSTQEEIDNFQANYPNCTQIAGNLIISGYDINNLNGLDVLTSVGVTLIIQNNPNLISLTGLENLESIGGRLNIRNNVLLTDLSGIDNVTSIGGNLSILSTALTSLTGLENLTSIGGNLVIGNFNFGNPSLTSLTGLNNVTSIGGVLWIEGNDALASLTGLDNLATIGGGLHIGRNDALVNLTGLDNVTSIGGYLWINSNDALTELIGLEGLTSIGSNLWIEDNEVLSSLTGLDGLTSIGGDFQIYSNYSLISLTGLGNLTSIEGNLSIGSWDYWHEGFIGNPSLISLTGLENVISIGGDLNILGNEVLSSCEVQSICNYIETPNGEIEIYVNAPGCNSQGEVELACQIVSLDEVQISDKLSIYPNPSSTQFTIELPDAQQKNAVLSIYNINSQQMLTSKITEQKTLVDISGLPNGIYFLKVADDRSVMVSKIVKK